MLTLTTMGTSVGNIAHLVRISTSEHLVDEVIIVGRIVAGAELFKPLPVLGKDLFKNVPAGNDFGRHGSISRWITGVL